MDDKDIATLRRFRSALDEPDPAALAARRPALESLTRPVTRPRPRWRLVAVPIGAAALVGAIVLVVTSTLPPGIGGEPQRPAPLASTASPSASPSPTPLSTRQVIEQLALLAENTPAPPRPRPDQLILQVQTQYDSVGAHKQERWLDPNGAILLRVRTYEAGGQVHEQSERERQRWIADFRADMAKVGPGLFYPNWTVLSTYTTDPEELLRELRKDRPYHAGDLAQLMGGIAEGTDALAPPRLKAGLLRVLGLVDGMTAELVTAPDGSQVWAIGGLQGETMRREVLVSATTGLIVGSRDVRLVDYVYPGGHPCFTCTPRPKASPVPIPPTVSNTIMWRTSLASR